MGFEPILASWKDDILPLDEKDFYITLGFNGIWTRINKFATYSNKPLYYKTISFKIIFNNGMGLQKIRGQRDSNPRYQRYVCFQDKCFQPLCHTPQKTAIYINK